MYAVRTLELIEPNVNTRMYTSSHFANPMRHYSIGQMRPCIALIDALAAYPAIPVANREANTIALPPYLA